MLGTSYLGQVRSKIDMWDSRIRRVSETIDEWLMLQRNWVYLENIFNGPDIQKQLPAETNRFRAVDSFWIALMRKTNKLPNVMACCKNDEFLEILKQNNASLGEISKSLEHYLL